MCETAHCLYPWVPASPVVIACLVAVSGLIVWKLIKALIDTIPIIG